MTKKLLGLPLVVLLAACASDPPNSDYFVAVFRPGTTELTSQGQAALRNALRELRRTEPSSVVLTGRSDDDPTHRALAEERAAAVKANMAAVRPRIAIEDTIESERPEDYAALGNSLVIQFRHDGEKAG